MKSELGERRILVFVQGSKWLIFKIELAELSESDLILLVSQAWARCDAPYPRLVVLTQTGVRNASQYQDVDPGSAGGGGQS